MAKKLIGKLMNKCVMKNKGNPNFLGPVGWLNKN